MRSSRIRNLLIGRSGVQIRFRTSKLTKPEPTKKYHRMAGERALPIIDNGFQEVPFMVHKNLTPLEAVAMAVRSEIESTNLYEKLIDRVRNPEVKAMLKEMAAEEDTHRLSLMQVYRDMLGEENPSIPESDGRTKEWDIDPEADFLTVMTKARDKEYDSEDFYTKAAQKVTDYKTRMFFIELAEQERKHASRLQKEVDKLKEDPHWFDREEGEQVHEGP
jgi:rubrerythrin